MDESDYQYESEVTNDFVGERDIDHQYESEEIGEYEGGPNYLHGSQMAGADERIAEEEPIMYQEESNIGPSFAPPQGRSSPRYDPYESGEESVWEIRKRPRYHKFQY